MFYVFQYVKMVHFKRLTDVCASWVMAYSICEGE